MTQKLILFLLTLGLGQAMFSQGNVKVDNVNLPIISDSKLELQISSAKKKYVKEELIEVDIALKNLGASKTKMLLLPAIYFYDFEVIGPKKTRVSSLPLASARFAGSREGFDFGKSKTYETTIDLNSYYDLSAPGTYKIKVSKKFRFDDPKKRPVTISSNVLSFNVVPSSPKTLRN